jgi:hypothetical protein
MFCRKSKLTKLLALLLSFSFLISSKIANATMGAMGVVMGGLLVFIGVKDVTKGKAIMSANCPNPTTAAMCSTGKWQLAQGLLEIAGGAASMLMNSENDKQTSPSGLGDFGKLTTGGLNPDLPKNPDGTTPNIPDKCKEFPNICKCNDASCNQPSLQLPPKEEIEGLMRQAAKFNPSDTTTLEDALSKLNEDYDKAEKGVAAFNRLSAAGAFDPSGAGSSTLGIDESGGTGDYVGLNKDGSDSGSKGGGSFDFSSNPLANNADLDNLKKMRGEPDPVTNVGMNLKNNNTNKLLTIFERAARVLRGDRNRDISLAKIEWTRKEAAKKQGKGPASIPSPKQ